MNKLIRILIFIMLICFVSHKMYAQISIKYIEHYHLDTNGINKPFDINLFEFSDNYWESPLIHDYFSYFIFESNSKSCKYNEQKLFTSYYFRYEDSLRYYFFSEFGFRIFEKSYPLFRSENKFRGTDSLFFKSFVRNDTTYVINKTIDQPYSGSLNGNYWILNTRTNITYYGTTDCSRQLFKVVDTLHSKGLVLNSFFNNDKSKLFSINTNGNIELFDINNKNKNRIIKLRNDSLYGEFKMIKSSSTNYLFVYPIFPIFNTQENYLINISTNKIINLGFINCFAKGVKFHPNKELLVWITHNSDSLCFYSLKNKRIKSISLREAFKKEIPFIKDYEIVDFSFKQDGSEISILRNDGIVIKLGIDFEKTKRH